MAGTGTTIDRVAVHRYALTYVHGEYVMSGNRVIVELESTVVEVTTRDGVTGYGEVCPLGPAYLPGSAEGAQAALHQMIPAVVGHDVRDVSAIGAAMDVALMGHRYAKSAVDIACWDALGRSCGLSVTSLLGGKLQESFPLYIAVPLAAPEDMAGYVKDRRAEGLHGFQLKIGGDPALDARRTAAVVSVTDDEDVIVADANGGWRLQEAVVAARLLEDMPRVYLEQPCRSLEECLIVRQRTTLPMVLDEVIDDVHTLLRAYQAGAMEAINLKISKVGGLSSGKLIRDLCERLGLKVTIEDTWGGDLTAAATAHLAASTKAETLFTCSFMNDWTNEHVAGYQPRSRDGVGSAPTGPGLGIEVDTGLLGAPLFSYPG
jgi:L-alanine-DL-glutamate epimerase-like enolase superfamily enzyme